MLGRGGIFSAKDAYKKVKLGASLLQLITGLVYQGPQLAAQINLELPQLLKKAVLKIFPKPLAQRLIMFDFAEVRF